MTRPNHKPRIIEHYDVVSPFYRSLWGDHLHHGYWIRGDESKEEAQLQLTEHLAQLANIKSGSDILDIGCGFPVRYHLHQREGGDESDASDAGVGVQIDEGHLTEALVAASGLVETRDLSLGEAARYRVENFLSPSAVGESIRRSLLGFIGTG